MESKTRKTRNEGGDQGPPKTHKLGLNLFSNSLYFIIRTNPNPRKRKTEKLRLGRTTRSSGFRLFPSFETVVMLRAFQVSSSFLLSLFSQIRSDQIRSLSDPFDWLFALILPSFMIFLFYFVRLLTVDRRRIQFVCSIDSGC